MDFFFQVGAYRKLKEKWTLSASLAYSIQFTQVRFAVDNIYFRDGSKVLFTSNQYYNYLLGGGLELTYQVFNIKSIGFLAGVRTTGLFSINKTLYFTEEAKFSRTNPIFDSIEIFPTIGIKITPHFSICLDYRILNYQAVDPAFLQEQKAHDFYNPRKFGFRLVHFIY